MGPGDDARRQRRLRLWLAGAGLGVLLPFAAVPLLRGGVDEAREAEPAARSEEVARTVAPRELVDQPTRGSLAGDGQWLAGVAALSWAWRDPAGARPVSEPVDPPAGTRTVAFAGDVPGGRVALVLARPEGAVVFHAWFTGPENADPGRMRLAARPAEVGPHDPLALWDVPARADSTVVTVVSFPGDRIEVVTGRTVTASGQTQERWAHVPSDDGAGAVRVDPLASRLGTPPVRILRQGGGVAPFYPELTDRSDGDGRPFPVEPADPRGLRGSVPEGQLDFAVGVLAAQYGANADDIALTLLLSTPGALLVGGTFPSGATTAYVATYRTDPRSTSGRPTYCTLVRPAPAGTAVLDRVFALRLSRSLVVSGPSAGARAEVLLLDGALAATVPLVDGAGIAPLPPRGAESVRILDGSGVPLVTAPISGPAG
ncbi:hypothetical protein [Geodermatophilus sp. URMC 64]